MTAFAAAFPSFLHDHVDHVTRAMPPATLPPHGSFAVVVDGEDVTIPMRIYNPEPAPSALAALGDDRATILQCLYTRHHDGFVRERHLHGIVESDHSWTAPFVVQLVGEYVLEIIVAVAEALRDLDAPGSSEGKRYGQFLAANPAFLELTSQRVVSYWNAYYRFDYPRLSDYPAARLLASFRRAAAEAA
jgi:hypothetical protein